MRRLIKRNGRSAAVAAVLAVATAGCGLGPGKSTPGEATLTVTHDYGAEPVLDATESDPAESETVIRFLDREAELTTRYGGGFVQAIDGTAGEVDDGRTLDWFFFVNGLESRQGSAEVPVRGGDRIWWDYRDWTNAISTPAVVGSWPEPFLQASTPESERLPVAVECLGAGEPCDEVASRLDDAEVDTGNGETGGPRLLVGPWARVRSDPLAAEVDRGPATSGVFARFVEDAGGWKLELLDAAGERARSLGTGVGLVAGVRRRSEPATWLVTGTDAAGVQRAAALLDADDLAQRYAVAADGSRPVAAPVTGAG